MEQEYTNRILIFNDESRQYFNDLQITDISQFLTDIIPVINANAQLERGFLLNILLEKLPQTLTDTQIQQLYTISVSPLDIPTKSAIIVLYHKYNLENLTNIILSQPPVRFLTKQAKSIAVPHFYNLILFIDTFAGEKELDIVLQCMKQLTKLRKSILSEFVLYALAEDQLKTNQTASFLLNLDLPAYEEAMQATFGYFFDYFPLNSDNNAVKNALVEAITIPGAAFDFYELFLERYREGADITRIWLESVFSDFLKRTEKLNSISFSNRNLRDLYTEICDYFGLKPLILHENFVDLPSEFDQNQFICVFGNGPQAYSSDLFDIASAGFMFGEPHYKEIITKLIQQDPEISRKIDILVSREVKFGAELTIKENIFQILQIACKIRFQSSVFDVIQSVNLFENSWELMSCAVVLSCFENFSRGGVQIPQIDRFLLRNFALKLLEFREKIPLQKLIFVLNLLDFDDLLTQNVRNAKLDHLDRFLHFRGISVFSVPQKSTHDLIISHEENVACYDVDVLLDQLLYQQLPTTFLADFDAKFDQNFVKILVQRLPVQFLLKAFSSDVFSDENIAFFVENLGDFAVSGARISRISRRFLSVKARLIMERKIEFPQDDFELVFAVKAIRKQRVSEVEFAAFLAIFERENCEIAALPLLAAEQIQRLLDVASVQNQCNILLLAQIDVSALKIDKLDRLSIIDITTDNIIIILQNLAILQRIDVNLLASICLQGIVSESEFERRMGLRLASQLPAGSVRHDVRRKVFQSVQDLLESPSAQVRELCRRVRVCWMEQ
ncbi:hypothetical protein SS50377_26255 [Spironucleus salmonicida]|uniref:Uncharacterized protein n=1 Tax=Spironucleus salmonicida TaxID=348837 RepID=V6LIE4_9EUKA|nr:hypothetical protein SS50377_26255 [Spironucleus salmonicida]|eukprot:EST44355.1 Hypothetical protein SS50377_15783 [Spironucleus salmonicida]